MFPGFIRDAGMFAKSGVKLPTGVGTRSPDDVARAVVDSVRNNPAEVTVAAMDQRFVAFFAGLAPGVVDFITTRTPLAYRLSEDVSSGQKRYEATQRDAR